MLGDLLVFRVYSKKQGMTIILLHYKYMVFKMLLFRIITNDPKIINSIF